MTSPHWPTLFLSSLSHKVTVIGENVNPTSLASKARKEKAKLALDNPRLHDVKVRCITNGIELVYVGYTVTLEVPSWRKELEEWLTSTGDEWEYHGTLTGSDRVWLAKLEREHRILCGFEKGLLVVRV